MQETKVNATMEAADSRTLSISKSMCSLSGVSLSVDDGKLPPKSTPKNRLKTFIDTGDFFGREPIADTFQNTTVMFLDIAGFTSYCASREPVCVFQLLESIYQSFDEATFKYGIFKVETIGDCYVAVTGVPDARDDHAVAMTRFAFDCVRRFKKVTKRLEQQLGEGTSALQARVGLHSGPVTGGVIRGQKARFQLFGDTMNTAARMESNSAGGRIQCSQATADLLMLANKAHWLTARPSKINPKGKGEMQTYWVAPSMNSFGTSEGGSKSSGSHSLGEASLASSSCCDVSVTNTNQPLLDIGGMSTSLMDVERITLSLSFIETNVETLYTLLQRIVVGRESSRPPLMKRFSNSRIVPGGVSSRPCLTRKNSINRLPGLSRGNSVHDVYDNETWILGGRLLSDEVVNVIEMPNFDERLAKRINKSPQQPTIALLVKDQLRDYLMRLASMHRELPFNSFERASDAVLNAYKLIQDIISVDVYHASSRTPSESARDEHRACGLGSDPLMQFAIVFCALIQAVDHTGHSNADLVHMQTPQAILYKNKHVAQQNSLDVAWTVLMDDDFRELRQTMYISKQELRRFRQLVVNGVIASDMEDDGTRRRLHERWNEANDEPTKATKAYNDLRATLLFEHLVQLASYSHMMQRWSDYAKWNEKRFQERFNSVVSRGVELSYTLFSSWYKNELELFDHVVSPLVQSVKHTAVLSPALIAELERNVDGNRRAWELQGEALVKAMYVKARKHHG